VSKWVTAWLTWLEHEKGRQATTRKLYERTLQTLERDTSGLGPLERLETSDLRQWLHSKGGSPSSWANRVAALRSFYGYLVDRNVRIDDPSRRLDVPKREAPVREPVRDLNAKLRVLDELDEKRGRRVGESRDMAVFLAYTGMRISDACNLSLKPPVPDRIVISRGRRHDKTIEVPFEACSALDNLGGRFGIGARALQRRFEKADFHPDQLRHWHRVNVAERRLRDEDAKELGGSITLSSARPRHEKSSQITLMSGEITQSNNRQTGADLIAEGHEQQQVEGAPDKQFWMEFAGQLEGIIELIRSRFAGDTP
jgi:integrase